jgi:hypothetical protein
MANPANPELEPAELRATVVDLHRHGKTFAQIGKDLGFSKQRAHALYWEAMDSVVDQAVKAHRAAMVEEIIEVIRVANEVMHTEHLAHSNGRVVTVKDADGVERTVLDDAPRLDAGRTIIAAHARLSRLVGADAATKVETDLNVLKYEVVGVDPSSLT